MTKEEAKQWSKLFTAIAEGNKIQSDAGGKWEDIRIDDYDYLEGFSSDYRIKPQPKTRRRTKQELADWLHNCPEENREWKWKGESLVHAYPMTYDEDEAQVECASDILIRRNHGEWEEPLIAIEE